ncbi:RNA polymerase sporulation sigma factor SigK [Desulfofundulus thermosubterraneus]|uniref:RNA polymerase sigma factor n=1 Tax=Desulfofundulus thermosubterraneus DSM 16057 TaxID=1121432 RepID=A0A1M6GER6_9FIRM|nr:RNA polymerase sporulation sigma factor SigK [Desulfofundulus thermosubterraneus]SHJ08417.1 RNA polymerase, sigma 27/28 subunit, RpsK/SigK [Desulfofundulus thermosubterraneus DSM 16057]
MLSALWVLLCLSLINGLLLLVSYTASNIFPQPLSEEEEAHYLNLAVKGDEKARAVLVEHNLRLVAHIVKKYEGTGKDTDDLISIGTIGLIKAINSFDPKKGTRLATYATRCIENEILMHLRLIKKTRREVSLYDPVGVDKEGNEITLIETLGTPPEIVSEMVETQLELKNLLERIVALSPQEKKVLTLRLGLISGVRATQREVARKLGISRSYVSRIEKRALYKLTREMKKESPPAP